jgi:hypothetical protein
MAVLEKPTEPQQSQYLALESYGVGDAPLSHAAERVHMSPVDTRRDGVVATGAVARNAHALGDRSTLEDSTLIGYPLPVPRRGYG